MSQNTIVSNKKKSNRPAPTPLIVFLQGHGSSGENAKVARLTLDHVALLQDFFNEALPLSLEVINSCYIGGINIAKITASTTPHFSKNYNYIMAIANSQESLTESFNDITHVGYRYFFAQGTYQPPRNIAQTENLIASILLGGNEHAAHMVKLPGQPWQQALPRKTAVTLGRILAQTRDSDDPLYFPSFFMVKPKEKTVAQPEIFLWYADRINFPIIFENAQLPLIGSLIPGDALHECAEVQVPATTTLKQLADAFLGVPVAVTKIFIIDKIEIKNLDNFPEKTKGLVEGWYCKLYFINENEETSYVILTVKDTTGASIFSFESSYKATADFDWKESTRDISKLVTKTRKSMQWGLKHLPIETAPGFVEKVRPKKSSIKHQ